MEISRKDVPFARTEDNYVAGILKANGRIIWVTSAETVGTAIYGTRMEGEKNRKFFRKHNIDLDKQLVTAKIIWKPSIPS